ncbi:hypothetical protein Dimus_027216 [Dionaea muscipula]
MSSPPRKWSWEPHLPYVFDPSLLEMAPLRIPSPAPDSPEYTCQGSEESSFSGDESCPPCELGEGDALCVSGRGVIPYALEEGATSRGLEGVPPSYPSATRLEGRSPRKLRIKLKPRSLELELSSSSFLSVGGGGSVRSHGPGDDDVGFYVGSEEAELRTPSLQDLTGIQSLDETGMTKGRRL